MSISLSDFYPLLWPELPGCMEFLFDRELQWVIDDFCKQTWVWQEELDPVYVFSGVRHYDLVVPPGSQIVGIVRIKNQAETELTEYVFDRIGEWIELASEPGSEDTYLVRAALKPTRDSNADYKDALLDDYSETITAGVKKRLMLMPRQQWSNPEMASYYVQVYKRGLGAAKIDGHRLMCGKRDLRVQPQRFV